MGKQLPALLQWLPQWVTTQWLASSVASDEDDDRASLPAGITQALAQRLKSLPTPQPYKEAIQLATRQALQTWQANPETANNCLVILGWPVVANDLMLKDSLQNYLLDCDVRFFLSGYQRPADPLEITGHLQRELSPDKDTDRAEPTAPVTQTELHEALPRVNVIPSLERCFLRCIQGWEGIEYLQNWVTQDTSRFWVFGCNHWAWAFLDKVCQVGAYLEQTQALPELSGEALAQWLRPMLTTAVKRPDGDTLEVQVASGDETYWQALASLAAGNATTAAYLWLQTLRLDADLLTPEGTLPAEAKSVEVTTTKPKAPSLISLEALDRYLLHALLIHGEMTRSHLALSMGEDERLIRSRVQVLRREGLIRQAGRRLTVHPAHYPKLYSELGNNNFLLGQA